MPVFRLPDKENIFPDPKFAEPDGLLAVGGDLSPERLLTAYSNGIFPWFSENDPILWWSPNPRFVLFPEKIHTAASLKKVIKKDLFRIRLNTNFDLVIDSCSSVPRGAQNGTWITVEMKEAYKKLHKLGFAVSVEAEIDNEIVGGLYGILIGKVFFGESMFSKVPNASKVAFTAFVKHLEKENVGLIDCQMHTDYLESLGAEMIPLKKFLSIIYKETRKKQIELPSEIYF